MISFNAEQVRDMAEFLGFTVDTHDIELDTEISVMKCPESGIVDEDDEEELRHHYEYIAIFSEYPEEGCVGLGAELSA